MNNVEPGELWYESSIHYENSYLNFAVGKYGKKKIISICLNLQTGKVSYDWAGSNESFKYSSVQLV